MKIFKKKITQEQVDRLNTINALSDRPIIKVCKLCRHYDMHYGIERCVRNQYAGFNHVNGKENMLGKIYYCEIERELDFDRPCSVADKRCCGAIGQFWQPAPPKVGFWQKMIKN